ncbi:MAG: pilus assembly protein PilZ [Desulfuromonadales bacterium]
MVGEDRLKRRFRKPFSVKFGIDAVDKIGITDDIHQDGLFIRSAVVLKPGRSLRIEIEQSQGLIALLGDVRWTRKVPPYMIHKRKGGMGLRIKSFLAGEEIYRTLCDDRVARGANERDLQRPQ